MGGNIHHLYKYDVTFIPVGLDQAPRDQTQNIETRSRCPSSILGDSMDLGHRSESQVDYQDYEAENVFSESKLKEGVYGDPLAFGMNNNRLLDGFY